MCLAEDVCVDDMLFIDVDDTDQIRSRYNGVLGLSPGSSTIQTSYTKRESNSYLDRLYESNLIDKKLFSMYLSDNRDPKDQSMITFGDYDVNRFAPNTNVTWNPVTDKTFWTLKLRKATIGDTMVVTSTKDAIIDSGTSYMAMPVSDLLSLVDMLYEVHGFKCSYDENIKLYYCDCEDLEVYKNKFPSLKVTLSETNTYEIPAKDFTQRTNNRCKL